MSFKDEIEITTHEDGIHCGACPMFVEGHVARVKGLCIFYHQKRRRQILDADPWTGEFGALEITDNELNEFFGDWQAFRGEKIDPTFALLAEYVRRMAFRVASLEAERKWKERQAP